MQADTMNHVMDSFPPDRVVFVGLGSIIVLHYRTFASYQIHEDNRCLYF